MKKGHSGGVVHGELKSAMEGCVDGMEKMMGCKLSGGCGCALEC